MSSSRTDGMNRRSILAGAGAGLAGLAGLGQAHAATLPTPEASEGFDVVVIGTGLAGSVAALEAASRGARVAVLEKSRRNRAGGNSLLAGGFFAVPKADTDEARGEFLEDFIAKGLGRGNARIYGLMAENGRSDVAWLAENGVELLPDGEMPPYRIASALIAPGAYMGMPRALRALHGAIAAKGGTLFFDTKARQLILNDKGAVAGVRAIGANGVVDFTARAVVIAAGGYGGNPAMLEAFADPEAGAMMVRGITWATGDGHLMAQQAGAGLKGMGGMGSLHVAAVDTVETAAGNPFSALPYAIAVNGEGKRFVDESLGYVAHGKAVMRQRGQTAAIILDDAVAQLAGPASSLATFRRLGIETVEADTIEELAVLIGVPAGELVATVEAFNAAVQDGAAPAAVPPKAALAQRIEKAPFRAFHPLGPGITLTFGGVMINEKAEVQEADGRIIAGLYAAGEGAGAVFFDDYIGGGSLTNCLVMGRIAGREAATA